MSYTCFASYYDRLTANVDDEMRGNYLLRILEQQGKQSGILLDLACGTGRLSEFFARRHYDVIGVDASEEMLGEAMEQKLQSGSDIVYLCQRMEELNLFGTVDVVLCALDSLNHITDQKLLRQVFERVSLFLNPDAVFIFDVNTVYKHEKVLRNNTFVYDLDEVYCVWQNRLLANHVVEITLDLFAYDEENDCYDRMGEQFEERAYDDMELTQMAEAAGFEVLHRYAENTFDPPVADTERVVYVLRNTVCKNAIPEEN